MRKPACISTPVSAKAAPSLPSPVDGAPGFYTEGLRRLPVATTVQRKCAHCAAEEKLQLKPFIQRDPSKKGAKKTAPAKLDRSGFEQIMQTEFGVKTITTGTQAMQESIVGQPIPGWAKWEPDVTLDQYQQIVDGFRDFRKVFGATPVITDIIFYEKKYDVVNGKVVADTITGAQTGTTDLTIYKTGSAMYKPLPLDKSNAQGTYASPPPMSLGMSYGGDPKSSPVIAPILWGDNFKRVIAHELGHGLQSAAMNLPNPAGSPDPKMLDDYSKAVGWTPYIPATKSQAAVQPQLYDISVKAVQTAIASGATPPAQYLITKGNWNDPVWGEQPISEYSLANAGDDFADSVMAFIYNPQVLQKRSPARYNFINTRRQKWLPQMHPPPKPGATGGKKP